MSSVSDIKLIRTDTTLDLSQKAEKRCLKTPTPGRVVEGSYPRDMVGSILSLTSRPAMHLRKGDGPKYELHAQNGFNMASMINTIDFRVVTVHYVC